MRCNDIIFESSVLLKDLGRVYPQAQASMPNNPMRVERFLSLLLPMVVMPAVVAVQSHLPLAEEEHSAAVYAVYVRDSITSIFSKASTYSSEALSKSSISDIEPGYTLWIQRLLQQNSAEDVLSFLGRANIFFATHKNKLETSAGVILHGHLIAQLTGNTPEWCIDKLVQASTKQSLFFVDAPIIHICTLMGDTMLPSDLGNILLDMNTSSTAIVLDVPEELDTARQIP